MCMLVVCVLSHVWLCMAPRTVAHFLLCSPLLCPWNFPSNNTGVGCCFLLQGICPTQGSNLCLLHSCITGGFFTTSARMLGLNKLANRSQIMRASFLLLEKKVTDKQRDKSRMNHLLVLDWNWRNQYQLMVFNVYSDRCISVQLLSCVWLFVTPWTAACRASLSFTISMSIESVMPSNRLCHPLLLLPSIFPSTRVFSSELALHIRWAKYWSNNRWICIEVKKPFVWTMN